MEDNLRTIKFLRALIKSALRDDDAFARDYHNGTRRDGLTTIVVSHKTMQLLEEQAKPAPGEEA